MGSAKRSSGPQGIRTNSGATYFTKQMGMKKQHLPSKICPVCQRPFSWRKKWEKNWEEVKYCSKRCSGDAKKSRH
ncbi:DUF2256 domain-containing protein [Algoriphagus sp. NBT04N3]|uniref:DUF2256 domain-containing protein n=1 Tax=Algoriphagus sp. NBT04N3 TaxID=2705473 RepID=UPI00351CEBEF